MKNCGNRLGTDRHGAGLHGQGKRMEHEWDRLRGVRAERQLPAISPVRVALLFSSAAIAVALIAAAYLDDGRDWSAQAKAVEPGGLDFMSTGSIGPVTKTYTIRKSVLQSSPDAECIIQADGTRSGEC